MTQISLKIEWRGMKRKKWLFDSNYLLIFESTFRVVKLLFLYLKMNHIIHSWKFSLKKISYHLWHLYFRSFIHTRLCKLFLPIIKSITVISHYWGLYQGYISFSTEEEKLKSFLLNNTLNPFKIRLNT